MSWWIPFAFIGAAILGILIAYSLTTGRSDARAAEQFVEPRRGRRRSRYEEDNELVWNPAAFVAAAGLIGVLVLIGILIQVL
jgi:hypothetical protein